MLREKKLAGEIAAKESKASLTAGKSITPKYFNNEVSSYNYLKDKMTQLTKEAKSKFSISTPRKKPGDRSHSLPRIVSKSRMPLFEAMDVSPSGIYLARARGSSQIEHN